jgi:hypothetical protein
MKVRFSIPLRGPMMEFERSALAGLFDLWRVGIMAGRRLGIQVFRDRAELRPSEYGVHLRERPHPRWGLGVHDEQSHYVVRSGVVEIETAYYHAPGDKLVVPLPMPLDLPWPRLQAATPERRRDMAVEEIQRRVRLHRAERTGNFEDTVPATYMRSLKPFQFERVTS